MFQAIILCNFQEHKWPKLQKMTKNLILDPILAHLVQIWGPNFFADFASTSN